MSMCATTNRSAPAGTVVNGQALVVYEVPALARAARDAVENHYVGTLSSWMLGAGFVGVLAGASVYFLAVSPYVISVLGPLLEIHG